MKSELDYRHEDMQHAMGAVSARMRRIADEIDRAANTLDRSPSYGQAARDVVAAVTWGVANSNLDQVARSAAEADAAVARRDAAQTKEAPRD